MAAQQRMQNLQTLVNYFDQHHLRLATAESCTAGLIASRLADVPGCGSWFECGFVTYAAEAKTYVLGVSKETIATFNLTSEQVAREMASGALHRSGANVAVANTGVAGPEPGEGGIAAGTICFAWAFERGGTTVLYSETQRFDGDRNAVRDA